MKRLSRLDGLRGVLAVYVMLSHVGPFVLLPRWLTAACSHGEAAVDLFFALSGLVIINSLEHFRYRFWPFLAARARRLLPVYFAVLAFATALLVLGNPVASLPWAPAAATAFWQAGLPAPFWAHFGAHVLLLHGLIPQGVLPYVWITVLPPAWSLSTEWQFYIIIALLLPVLPRESLTLFALGMLGVGAAWHLVAPHLPAYWQFSRAFLPDAAPFFALGLAGAVWFRGGGVALFGICLAVACLLGLLSGQASKALIPLGWALALLVQRRPGFPLLGALLDSRAAQYLGAISYPLYLLNEPVQRAAAMFLAPHFGGGKLDFTLVWLPAAVIGPLVLAALLHHMIEKPMMRPGRKVSHGSETIRLSFGKEDSGSTAPGGAFARNDGETLNDGVG
jgi:peptidoglycan/LPS O-acetylase OafA/YrhL